jgi:hypothetical protein
MIDSDGNFKVYVLSAFNRNAQGITDHTNTTVNSVIGAVDALEFLES